MFSDKQRQSWQNINAPDDLLLKTRERLESGSYRHSRGFKRYSLPLIAASLFLIFVSVFLIGRGNVANVYVDGIELTEEVRVFASEPMPFSARSVMRSSVITLSFDIKSETVIKASVGSFDVVNADGEVLYSGNEYTADEDITVIWSYFVDYEDVHLDIIGKTHDGVVTVSHNVETDSREINYVKN